MTRKAYPSDVTNAPVANHTTVAPARTNHWSSAPSGLARTRLAKSIYDVSWGKFITILEAVVVKYGVHLVKVNPHNTTQDCSSCGTKVPKTLCVRLHECPKCSVEMDRDENAAINILMKALQVVGLTSSACGALVDGQAMK
jgi:putative transposase